MILKVHHAQITVPKGAEDKARGYYCELLGFREIAKPEALISRGGFWLELDGLQIHIGTEDGLDRKLTKAHLAYQVSSIGEWKTKIQEGGYDVLDGIPVPGMSRFESRDPFGNRIEFLELTNN
jgi:catechol 2,3-dioxygenase-like lactoylglutathione lyase family enzyme